MATFTYTITDPGGVDLSLIFPGTIGTRWTSTSTSPTQALMSYRLIVDGTADLTKLFRINMTGSGFAFASGDGGVSGLIDGATLSVMEGVVTTPLATLTVALGDVTGIIGGIAIPAAMDMSPNSITRLAARADTDGANLILNGGTGNDTLPGSTWDDTLNGGVGSDRMVGGDGNDLYFVDNAFDVVIEGEDGGIDRINASVSYILANGAAVEQIYADPSAGALNLTGNAFANSLFGNDAANVLDGAGGIDNMAGMAGDDTYHVDNDLDTIVENSAEGNDIVLASANYTLKTSVSVETLQASVPGSKSTLNLAGNEFANIIKGNAGNNQLGGGLGDDVLYGGLGRDRLDGGDGKDAFAFTTKPHKTSNFDRITDFNVKQDSVWLENAVFKGLGSSGSSTNPLKIKSASFFKGKAAHDSNDRVIYDPGSGGLFYDADGSGNGAAVRIAVLSKGLKITANDFFSI